MSEQNPTLIAESIQERERFSLQGKFASWSLLGMAPGCSSWFFSSQRKLLLSSLALAFLGGVGVAEPQDTNSHAKEREVMVEMTSNLFLEIERCGATTAAPTGPLENNPLGKFNPASFQADSDLKEANICNQEPIHRLLGYRLTYYPTEAKTIWTVDFMGTFGKNSGLACGYLSWDTTNPSAPELAHIEVRLLNFSDLLELGEKDAHVVLLEANCAYGALDPNLFVFDQINAAEFQGEHGIDANPEKGWNVIELN